MLSSPQCGSYLYGRIFFIALLIGAITLPVSALAACPIGTQLLTNKSVIESLSGQNFALASGSLSSSMDLGSSFANAHLTLTDPSSLVQTVAIGPNPRYWHLTMPEGFAITSKDLTVHYKVRGHNGKHNVISATDNPNSIVGVSVQSSKIETQQKDKKTQFFGSIVLALDLRTALISGPHNGTLTVTIDCF